VWTFYGVLLCVRWFARPVCVDCPAGSCWIYVQCVPGSGSLQAQKRAAGGKISLWIRLFHILMKVQGACTSTRVAHPALGCCGLHLPAPQPAVSTGLLHKWGMFPGAAVRMQARTSPRQSTSPHPGPCTNRVLALLTASCCHINGRCTAPGLPVAASSLGAPC